MRTDIIDDAIQTLLETDAPEQGKRDLLARLRAVREGLCGHPDCKRWCPAVCRESEQLVA